MLGLGLMLMLMLGLMLGLGLGLIWFKGADFFLHLFFCVPNRKSSKPSQLNDIRLCV